ncbi:MAG: biopolymer transporter ExbD [Gammaproteobacteria bacterium]|nr:biopolymer transporter ExbD [Gammaproteobacteria bacterium]
MKFQRRKDSQVDVNITPMIDVVFLLLIFFMVSTTFTKESRLALELPEAGGERVGAKAELLEVSISPSGRFGINGKYLVDRKAKTLHAALGEAIVPFDKLPPLVIVADGRSPHQSVVTAMDIAGKLGFVQIRIASVAPPEE